MNHFILLGGETSTFEVGGLFFFFFYRVAILYRSGKIYWVKRQHTFVHSMKFIHIIWHWRSISISSFIFSFSVQRFLSYFSFFFFPFTITIIVLFFIFFHSWLFSHVHGIWNSTNEKNFSGIWASSVPVYGTAAAYLNLKERRKCMSEVGRHIYIYDEVREMWQQSGERKRMRNENGLPGK